jgi:hypothetical protein
MMNYNPAVGYTFDGKVDCNGKVGVAGNYKVAYKGDKLTATILWFVDLNGKLVAPAHNDLMKGFSPIASSVIDSEESFEEDMERFIRSNKPYYGMVDNAIPCVLKLKFDEKGNIEDDSEFDFFIQRTTQTVKKDDGTLDVQWLCDKWVTGPANESMFLWHQDEKLYLGYVNKIKQQLTKDICEDRLSFLSYLVKDR